MLKISFFLSHALVHLSFPTQGKSQISSPPSPYPAVQDTWHTGSMMISNFLLSCAVIWMYAFEDYSSFVCLFFVVWAVLCLNALSCAFAGCALTHIYGKVYWNMNVCVYIFWCMWLSGLAHALSDAYNWKYLVMLCNWQRK